MVVPPFPQADGPGQGNDQRGPANQMPGSRDPGNVSFLGPRRLGAGGLSLSGRQLPPLEGEG